MHGMADDNVLLQNTTELMAKLQQEKVPFEVMLYPGQAHSAPSSSVAVHLWRTIENFLARNNVGPEAR